MDIFWRLSEKYVSATAQTHLLYTRFMSVSSQLAPLLSKFERRAQTHTDELSALLAECHTAYFTARKSLLVNQLINEIKGLDPTRTELVELVSVPLERYTLESGWIHYLKTRTGCNYLTFKMGCHRDPELWQFSGLVTGDQL